MSLVVPASLAPLLPLSRGVRGPQGQVISQQLHDQGAVLVAVLVQSVQLSNRIVKCLQEGQVLRLSNEMKLSVEIVSPVLLTDTPCPVKT